MQCKDVEFITVEHRDINDKLMTTPQAINYTLQKLGKREFIKIKKVYDSYYIVAKKD